MSTLALASVAAAGAAAGLGSCSGSGTGPGAGSGPGSGGSPAGAGRPLRPPARHDGCVTRGALPDPACTPGAVLTTDLTRICRPGYTPTVRSVDPALKQRVYRSYGIGRHLRGAYEIDHLVALELGGGNDPANLWPEAASPTPGYHEKDALENHLHDQVCTGRLPLERAQSQIATDWVSAWKSAGQPSGYAS
ncbi:MAG: HNH endonuclease [Actinobacteria bacterium]|nr:MAG: HNH endonuclease [Actinomycetota bacterium]